MTKLEAVRFRRIWFRGVVACCDIGTLLEILPYRTGGSRYLVLRELRQRGVWV